MPTINSLKKECGKDFWFQNDKKATEAAYSLHFYDFSLIIFVVIGKTPELVKFIHARSNPRQVFPDEGNQTWDS
jgi:hypothetical protein